MPRNGSGTYNLPGGVNPVVTQTLITSDWANTTMDDLAVAITNSIAKDGQTVPTANLPMGNFRHVNVGAPTLRNQYNTLGYAQDSTAIRVSGVSGTNDLIGTLPGGATSLTLGQLVQLIPVDTNTGPSTLNINGIGAKPIITDVGSMMAPGNLIAGRPYLLMYNGAEFVMLTGGAGSIAQSAISGWDRPSPDAPYPEITEVSSTVVAVPAGHGRIVHPSARDISGVKEINWSAQNVNLTNVASAWATLLAVDENGDVVQFSGQLNASWARENILLGVVTHINGAIDSISTAPAIYGDMMYASYDLTTLFNNTFISGGNLYANGASPFHVNMTPGALFSLGINSAEVNSPNIAQLPAVDDVTFYPVTGASAVAPPTQDVPVTQYDANGTGVVDTLPGVTTATIHRMYMLNDEFIFVYGQNTYADLAAALNQIAVDDSNFNPPSKLQNATFLGRIVAQKDCANLNDTTKARFISGNSIGSGGSSSGGISDAPIDGSTYGRRDATWVEVVPSPDGLAGTMRLIDFYTSNVLRWDMGANNEAESGSNAGSNFILRSYNDAGGLLGTAVEFDRATRAATLFANPTVERASDATLFLNNTGNAANSRKAQISMTAAGQPYWGAANDDGSPKTYVRIPTAGGLELGLAASNPFFSINPTVISANFSANLNAGRMYVQSNVSNGDTLFDVVPNGTAQRSWIGATNSSNTTDYGGVRLEASSSAMVVHSYKAGTGIVQPMSFRFDGTEKALLGTNGDFTVQGRLTAVSHFNSSSSTAILSAEGGEVRLRPNGKDSTSNQAILATDGTFTAVTVSGSGGIGFNFATAGLAYFTSNSPHIAYYKKNSSGTYNFYWRRSDDGQQGGANETTLMQLADNGQLTVAGTIITSNASTSGFRFVDRTSSRNWLWYGTGDTAWLHNGSAGIISVSASGVMTGSNFIATSDRNLKHDILDAKPREGLADSLRFVSYVLNVDPTNTKQLGLIAQEVQEVAPEYVTVVPAEKPFLAIDKMGLLTECVLEQAATIRRLKAELDELREKVNAIAG